MKRKHKKTGMLLQRDMDNHATATGLYSVSSRKITASFWHAALTHHLQNSQSATFPDGWRDMELLEMTDDQLMELFDELEALVCVDGAKH